MTKSIIQKVKALPPLPSTFQKINEISRDPNGSLSEIMKVIQKDPMLTANLLKIANSPLYGFQKEVKNINQAISLFGMSMTKTLALNLSIKKLLKVDMKPYGITPEEFANISNMQSILIKKWYSNIDQKAVEILFLAALLQETGKVIIADEIIKEQEIESFKNDIESSIETDEVEKTFVGVTTAEVTSAIFEHWNFDETMVEAIRYSDEYKRAPKKIYNLSLALKVTKTAIAINNPLSEENIQRALEILEKENMDKDYFLEAIEQIQSVPAL